MEKIFSHRYHLVDNKQEHEYIKIDKSLVNDHIDNIYVFGYNTYNYNTPITDSDGKGNLPELVLFPEIAIHY